jgi:hypothetical protein
VAKRVGGKPGTGGESKGGAASPSSSASPRQPRTPEEQEHSLIRRILQVTLEADGHTVCANIRGLDGMDSATLGPLLARASLNEIMFARLSVAVSSLATGAGEPAPRCTTFEYLVQCHARAGEEGRRRWKAGSDDAKARADALVEEIQTICTNYACTAIVEGGADMFPDCAEGGATSELLGTGRIGGGGGGGRDRQLVGGCVCGKKIGRG